MLDLEMGKGYQVFPGIIWIFEHMKETVSVEIHSSLELLSIQIKVARKTNCSEARKWPCLPLILYST